MIEPHKAGTGNHREAKRLKTHFLKHYHINWQQEAIVPQHFTKPLNSNDMRQDKIRFPIYGWDKYKSIEDIIMAFKDNPYKNLRTYICKIVEYFMFPTKEKSAVFKSLFKIREIRSF